MLLWTPAHSHSGCTSSSHATLRLEIYAPPKQPGTPNPELGTAPRAHGFAWQNDYGAFSVSESNAEALLAYITNQAEHHRKYSFQEEVRELLKRHRITDPLFRCKIILKLALMG